MARLTRAIDVRGAVAINVITMIGIGPLVTIPLVLAALGGPLALVGWLAGAVVALCDGLVWAELASRFPGSGGTYVYLREAFGAHGLGKLLAFLFNWQFLLYAPCLLASGYIGLTDYAAYLVPALAHSPIAHAATAIAVGIATILLLARRTARVAALAAWLAAAAVATVALVAVAGLTHADFTHALALPAPLHFGAGLLAGFASALYITLYDYVGYADAALLGDEVVRPVRTIPRSIVISIAIVATLYVALQLGVLGAIPWRSLLDAHGNPTAASQYVGALVVARAWGGTAATIVTLLVLVTAFASLYGNLLGFSRIPFAAACDGAFLPAFAAIHPRKQIPHVALYAIGGLSLIAALFSLAQVIAILTAGIALIQGAAQVAALIVLRTRREAAPFRMPLYPLPALLALGGWLLAFAYTGTPAMLLGLGWLAIGALAYVASARSERWWPFVALAACCVLPLQARAATPPSPWTTWQTARIVTRHGHPVFTVDGKPFFIDGAAFFYERIPRSEWRPALEAYRAMGINTIDLYAIWNWHVLGPSATAQGMRFDFDGRSDPRRDLLGLLRLIDRLGFKIVLRPGPVIRNEWRNGGYPGWLLARPAYRMPLHDVLSGRYPATATLQNTQADAAAREWLHNRTHLAYAGVWLHALLGAVAPYAHDVIAIALDDDQGAYMDNDTWPAPHWHRYVGWLRRTVTEVTGTRVPLFINTYDMKVPYDTPAWAWGDWYQSDAYRIGAHDLAQLDFATGLLHTQPRAPTLMAEFQAGWLQGAAAAEPRPSDPSNTALALHELLRDGVHGVVNFPLQDTIDPPGWEAPWANWSYAWDAALGIDLAPSPRYAPTLAFGATIARFGALLAATHPVADGAILWPPALFAPSALGNDDFAAFEAATIAAQRACRARGLTCVLRDPRALAARPAPRYRFVLLPSLAPRLAGLMRPSMQRQLAALRRAGVLREDLTGVTPRFAGGSAATLLMADDRRYAFVDAIDRHRTPLRLGPWQIDLDDRTVVVPAFTLPARSARLIPIGVPSPLPTPPAAVTPAVVARSPFRGAGFVRLRNAALRIAFAPAAGARIAELRLRGSQHNAATWIGLLRDAILPPPSPSPRDYIAAYTHPLPAGTFNRSYVCRTTPRQARCRYDAPDLPRGGALFERTLRVIPGSGHVDVRETFVPHDAAVPVQLASISGFAMNPGDVAIAPATRPYVGIFGGSQLAWIAWPPGTAVRTLRATRGAMLITLAFAQRTACWELGLRRVGNPTEARRFLRANAARLAAAPRERCARGSGGMADAAASKAAEATHVGSTPTFPKPGGA